ncbi:MAG: AraC family transcriptional regulator [Kiritimatiellia bacterium]
MENNDIYLKSTTKSLLRNPGSHAHTPFRIRTLGRIDRQPAHLTRGTYFGDAMLTWIHAGEGRYMWGTESLRVGPGMLGMVLPEEDPGFLRADPNNPYLHLYCRFAGTEALRMAREIRSGMPAAFAPHPGGAEAARLLENMLTEERQRRRRSETSAFMTPAEAGLARVLAVLLQPPASSAGHRRLGREELSTHILDHLHEPVSLDRAASRFGLSRGHFSREAKRLLGTSFQKAVEREKMIWSTTLLNDPGMNLNIAEVAYRLGYADPLYFSKVFKRHHGIPPSAFRI